MTTNEIRHWAKQNPDKQAEIWYVEDRPKGSGGRRGYQTTHNVYYARDGKVALRRTWRKLNGESLTKWRWNGVDPTTREVFLDAHFEEGFQSYCQVVHPPLIVTIDARQSPVVIQEYPGTIASASIRYYSDRVELCPNPDLATYQKLLDRQQGQARLYSDPEVMQLARFRETYPWFEAQYFYQVKAVTKIPAIETTAN